ncbi:MAG: hypothetical protein IKD81_02830 [Eubacteriaceae bacterium]|nr:hypothetical protein [Eubacteriaceae bacterium]
MIRDELYDKAIELRNASPWFELLGEDIFAVEFSDGELGYVMMNEGSDDEELYVDDLTEELSMYLFIGEDGLRSMRDLFEDCCEDRDRYAFRSPDEMPEDEDIDPDRDYTEEEYIRLTADKMLKTARFLTRGDYLALEYCPGDELTAEEHSAVSKALKRLKISTKRMNGLFPWFYTLRNGHPADNDLSEADQKYMSEALDALKALSCAFDAGTYDVTDFWELFDNGHLPLVRRDGSIGYTDLPRIPERTVKGILKDGTLSERIKKQAKNDTWQCLASELPQAVFEDDKDDESFFPMCVFCFPESEMKVLLPVLCRRLPGEGDVYALDEIAQLILSRPQKPSMILVRDTETQHLLADFCRECGIILSIGADTYVIDDFFVSYIGSDFMEEMEYYPYDDDDKDFEYDDNHYSIIAEDLYRALPRISDEDILLLPDDVKDTLLMMMEQDPSFPRGLKKRLSKLIKG